MKITQTILDKLTEQAKASPRLRMNLDLRNSPEDNSQRMLNAIEPGTVMPIHRHRTSSETVVCLRGHFEEYFYDDSGVLTATIDMLPGGPRRRPQRPRRSLAQPPIHGIRHRPPRMQRRQVRAAGGGGYLEITL